jgi:hypothetical protein
MYDTRSFFSCIGDSDEVLRPVSERKVWPIQLLGPAPYRLGGKNLGERIEKLYQDIGNYAAFLLSKNYGK